MKELALLVGSGLLTALAIAAPWIISPERPPNVVVAISSNVQSPTPVMHPDSGTIASLSHHASTAPGSASRSLPADSNSDADVEDVDRVIGTWTMSDHGQRTIAIHSDGTAAMRVNLDVLGAMIYGPRLDLRLKWTLADGVLTHVLEGGEPRAVVDRLRRDFGSRREYRILKITETQMHLQELGVEGEPEIWQAVSPNP